MRVAALLCLLLTASAYANEIPEIVATRAINGEFGPLSEWQRVGYTRLLHHGAVRKTAWVTNYWTGEPGVGTRCASGRKVERGRTAAMLHHSGRRLRVGEFGYFVLISLPSGYELRQVWDTGSPKNQKRATDRNADTWIDRYITHKSNTTWTTDIYIQKGHG
jgi:hypothetical protein